MFYTATLQVSIYYMNQGMTLPYKRISLHSLIKHPLMYKDVQVSVRMFPLDIIPESRCCEVNCSPHVASTVLAPSFSCLGRQVEASNCFLFPQSNTPIN